MKFLLLPIVAVAALSSGSAYAQDAKAGETVFKKCSSCHAIGEGATNRMGPVLTGVVGRVAGTYEGYKYSKPVTDAGAGGLVWTPENIDKFIASPKDFIKGTKMNFALRDPTDRANVIAYLATFSPPAAGAAPGAAPAPAAGTPAAPAATTPAPTAPAAPAAPVPAAP